MKEYTVRVYDNGTKEWLFDDELHREDGPAFEGCSGFKSWWRNGKRHREDGPAVVWPTGAKEWWLNGVQYSENDLKIRLAAKTDSTCNGREIVIDGKTYVLKLKA
jgi:hypothetical protein